MSFRLSPCGHAHPYQGDSPYHVIVLYEDVWCVRYRADSYPIHHLTECRPHLNWVHAPSNGGWSVSWNSIPRSIYTHNITRLRLCLD